MTPAFQITQAARAEVAEAFGLDFADSLLGLFDVKGVYAPICGDCETGRVYLDVSRAHSLFADQVEPH